MTSGSLLGCRGPDPVGLDAIGWCGAVAQMGERCNRTAEVRGSIPLSSTSRRKGHRGFASYLFRHTPPTTGRGLNAPS